MNYDFAIKSGITVSHIYEAEVLEKYKNEVRSKAAETMTAEDMEYIEEDLRSPCTVPENRSSPLRAAGRTDRWKGRAALLQGRNSRR